MRKSLDLQLCGLALAATLTAQPNTSQFDYDRTKLPELSCEDLAQRPDAFVRGCGFPAPSGGELTLILVSPKIAKPPYAGVIFQHGGGQSMTNYISEALILARAGVVSILADAPARGSGALTELNQTKLEAAGKFQASIVISLRIALEHLIRQKGVDPTRLAYVGHSYGSVAGGVLAGIEPRFHSFVLLGAVVSEATHIRTSRVPYWEEMRKQMTPVEFERTLEAIDAADPVHFLPLAKAPVLVQCARFDLPDNIAACPKVHEAAGGPKRLIWYLDDHYFTSLEAMRDRLDFLSQHLRLQDINRHLRDFLNR